MPEEQIRTLAEDLVEYHKTEVATTRIDIAEPRSEVRAGMAAAQLELKAGIIEVRAKAGELRIELKDEATGIRDALL